MTQLKERAKILIDLAGGSPTRLAEIAGVKPPSVSQWLNGNTKTLKSSPAARMAKHFGLNPLWVSDGIGHMRSDTNSHPTGSLITDPGTNRLPIRRGLFKLSAGVSGYEIEYENGESEPIFMAKRWFDHNHYNPDRLIALKVNGRSMEPKMYDGDLVIVNTDSHTPKDGVVFAINYEGEMVIKRMKRDSGQWFISSDNPDKIRFGDKVCADGCFILGEVVYLQTETI